jgi:molybdopterin converting factor small subunit
MFKCVVEMFGLPPNITELRQVEVKVEDGASPRDVVTALRCAIPALEGRVMHSEEDRLVDDYGFYINGCFYTGDQEVKLKEGDRIVLLTLASGG